MKNKIQQHQSPSPEALQALELAQDNHKACLKLKGYYTDMRNDLRRAKENVYEAKNNVSRHEAECAIKSQLMLDKIETINSKVDSMSSTIAVWLRTFVFMLLASWGGLAVLVMKLIVKT